MLRGGQFIIPVGILPEISTIDGLDEEQRQIRDTVRRFVREEITKEVSDRIESQDFSLTRSLMGKLAEIGLLGVEIPEQYGGGGLDKISSTIVAEENARQTSFAVSVLAHKGIGTWPIVFFGTEEQKKKYLPKLATGELISAYSLTETGSGSDARAARSTAVRTSGGFLLNGEKIFVTNGGFADVVVMFVQLEGKLTAFIAETKLAGVKVEREEHKIGIRGSSTATISLTNVFVPEENILGEPGLGFKIAMSILNLGRFSLGSACLGAGRLCLEEATQYARERKQFGKSIIEFGLIRQKLADMAARVYAMESVVYRTAGSLDSAISQVSSEDTVAALKAIGEYAIECSIVKVFCSEALDFIVDENVQIHGGYGFCEDYPAARHYRDSRINRLFEGTNEINRLVIIGMLLKRAAELQLPVFIQQVITEAMGSVPQEEPDNLVAQLLVRLDSAKKATLLAGGMASQRFLLPEELETHQFILAELSDCLIDVYALESMLAVLAGNAGKDGKREYLTRLLFAQMLPAVGTRVKNIFAACSEGDELRVRLAMLKRLLKITPENLEFLHNKVVGE